MDALVTYFHTIPSTHRALILAGGLSFFWLIEGAFPVYKFTYNKWKHAGLNLFFTLTTVLVNFLLAFTLVKVSDWVHVNSIGILNWLPNLPVFVYALLGLMLLDLIGAWLAHWVQHKVKWLWRFHVIHHTDQQVDTTTANRHHPGESVVRFVFTLLAVLVSGADMWLVFLYQSLSVVLSQFNHANIFLPTSLDRWISKVIVTPNMHHIHHHYVQPYTDTNYGNIFSIWDRLFQTFAQLSKEKIVYGVDTLLVKEETENLQKLLKFPFESEK